MPDPSPLLAAIRQPAFLYGTDGLIAEANDLAEALAGRPLAGRSLAAMVGLFDARSPDGERLLLAAEMPAARALAGEETIDVPMAVTAADGRRLHVLATASPVRNGSAITGALAIWQDVSALETARAGAETAAEELRVQEEELRQQGEELVKAVSDLDRQRRLLDAILATVPYRVSLWDRDERIAWANERFAADQGTPREALVGRSWRELGDPAGIVEPLVSHALQAVRAGATITREVEVPGQDGPAWMAHTFLPFGPDALLVISGDVTERKRAEEEVRSVALFPLQNPYPVLRADQEGRILYYNPAAAVLPGGLEIGAPLPGPLCRAARESCDGGAERKIELAFGPSTYAIAVVPLPEHGYVNLYFDDITERKRAEETLRRKQAEVQTLLENTPAGLVLFEGAPPYTVLAHNHYYQELFAEPFQSTGMVGLNIYEYAPAVDAEGVAAVFDDVVRTGEPQSLLDFPYRSNPPKQSWFNWYISPLILDDKVVALVSMSLDVTDRHLAEEALLQAQRHYQALLDHSTLSFARCRTLFDADGVPDDYEFVEVNEAYLAMTGFSDLVGRRITEVVPGMERDVIDFHNEVALGGVSRQTEVYSGPLDRWYQVNVYSPEPGEFIALSRDITDRVKAEEALRESEQTLQSIFRAAPVGIGISSDRTIRSVNASLCAMTGYAGEELVGHPTRVLYPSDEEYDRAGAEKYGQIIESGVGAVETRWRRKDGGLIEVLLSASPMDRSSPYKNVVTIALDLTLLREKEAALRESEARFRAAFEHSPLGMGLGDPDGRVLASNAALEELLGYGKDELRGMSFAEFTHPDDLGREGELLDRVLAGEAEWYEMEKRYLRRDGRVVLVRLVAALFRDGAGAPQGWIALHEDITEQKRTEAALMESEANMARAQSTAHLGNWSWDLATNAISCSDEHCRLYGLAPGEYPIETFTDLVHEGDRQSVRDALAASLDEGTPYSVECRVVRPDGTERILHGEGEVIRDPDGRVTGMFGIAQDITGQRTAEEALREYAEDLRRSNEDLERYAYVSSHDLQEPLRSIVSFSQLLEKRYKGQLGQDADEYIGFIVEGGNRMQTLILDLLAYSRVNSKAQEFRPTDAEAVMASVERSLDHQLREASAIVTYDPLPTVLADPLQLEQVFANLISNAVKFRRENEPLRIHVGARRLDGFWEFSVQDNGIGIDPQYSDQIFVIFQRLHTRDAYPGTGIGLAIVKRIVDRHGGTVRVESTPGQGSTFYFTLPDGSFKNGGGGGNRRRVAPRPDNDGDEAGPAR